ncbi:MAG: PIG-L family deacetylase [Gammaproteobacteria bacterium]|nr:PIG-L family deacetylase [Gammaproteobacteria bacterium]
MRAGGGHILCLGAHCDDIDIGAGGTLIKWLAQWPQTRVTWVALSSDSRRAAELRASAQLFLAGAAEYDVLCAEFKNGFFPFHGDPIKEYFEALKELPNPDIVFTHQRDDRHQDHRLVSELTWNTFRNHMVLEYEIPKYDGELVQPNTFVEIEEEIIDRKSRILTECYPSQQDKQWFDRDLFRGIARLRGVECASSTRFAEAFSGRKLVL